MKFSKTIAPAVVIIILLSSPLFAQWAFDTAITVGTNTSGIAITSDGRKLVVTNNTNPGSVTIISTSNYSTTNVDISSIENYPNAVTIAPNDSTALVNTLHNTIFIDLYNHTIKGKFTAPCAGTTLYGIAVTPNGKTGVYPDLSSGCTQQGLRLLDATGKTSINSFIQVNTTGELSGIAITPNGTKALVTTFTHDSPKLVDIATSGVQNISGMPSGSYGVAILHNGNEAFDLEQNYPNPFNPTTTISYSLPKASFISIKLYDALGHELATLVNGEKAAGRYSVQLSANSLKLSSGVYFYRIQADNFISVKKMILMK